ncbi:MAG: LCP family protein [Acetivibrionales bacterium]|jgi:LCP family protein required for cell wall assembly|nr:LytR family transcriptional regulator [Clostridiaceae bacterium]
MASQNLSAGTNEEPEKPGIITPTPNPYENVVVPNDDLEEDDSFFLTNNQKYFESIVSPESTNVLLLGTEPSGFNFDTIMILNIDKVSKKVTVISLPRDIYIDYSDYVIDALRKTNPSYLKEKGMHRINAAPSIGQTIEYQKGVGRFNKPYVDFIADIIHEVFDIYINDYAYVKVKGFRNIVDYFGGVTVYVPVHMEYNDPYQDLNIYIEKGTQHLNGAQAEGYVRFRQGFDENGKFQNYGDIFRKNNQNRFIKAFISQHVTLKNLGRLSKIAELISSNINTSVKGWDSIVNYGALAEEALNNKYPIENYNLKFTDKFIDGSSYVLIETR